MADTAISPFRVVQLAADYAFTFCVGPGGVSPIEWITSQVAELPESGPRRIQELTDWNACVHPDDQGTLERARSGGADTALEYRMISRDDRVRWFRESIAVEPDADGGERVWVVGHDITAQSIAEEAIRAAERKYRALFDTSRDGIKFTKLDGEIEEANQAYLDMIGYTLDELRRIEYRKLTPLRWWPIESDIIANQVMRRGYSDEYEKEYIRKDGSVFPVQVRLWLVRDETGKPARFFGIFRDITERKRHEHATRHRQAQLAHVARLSTVGEMAAGLAHELNQPLSALTNYAHGCLRRLDSGDAGGDTLKTALEHITVQAARASEIVRRVRTFVSKDDQRHADTDINELVHHGVDMVDLDFRRNAVQVNIELADELPMMHVDAVQIEQVIINLLLNAAEAMRQHGTKDPLVTLRTALQDRAVCVTVEDNGPGVDPAVIDQIFDPFFTTKERGMGMGLSICRSIIEQHGGRLSAGRSPAGGAVFSLLIPTVEGGVAHGI